MQAGRLLRLAVILISLAACGLSAPAEAAAPPSFPFVIPWDDARSHVITDASFLNGPIEPVVARDGHFYGTTSGKRIRFVGTNFTFAANFPDHDSAERVAAHLAKFGVNLVRIHQLDNVWEAPGSIWDQSFPDHRHISKTQMERLDYLVWQLEKHGIYVDMNLHTTRRFSAADGFLASVDSIPPGSDKHVDNFDRTMISLQKEYARDLLTHLNPYTKLSYAHDPGVALVEINNENSLLGDPWAEYGAGLDTLPEPFLGELRGLWNAWLKRRYVTDEALHEAWTRDLPRAGASVIPATSSWYLELNGGNATQGTLTPTSPSETGAAPDADIDIVQSDGFNWHIQATLTRLTLEEGATYTVSFRARADSPRTVTFNAGLDQSDWHLIGLSTNVALTTDWQTYSYTVQAKGTVPGHCRVSFVIGTDPGKMWIAGLKIVRGIEGDALLPGESLADASVRMPGGFTIPQQKWDWRRFLEDTEHDYAEEMRTFLKDILEVHACVADSQVSFSGLSSIGRERSMDFADNHAYWQHPTFPHKQWDYSDWRIENRSMVSDAGGVAGTLVTLAEYRVAGKPYTVSEYNHPAPNDFQSETVPMIFTFAAAQDWDAVLLFDYGGYGPCIANDQVTGFFGVGPNPAKMAFLPAASVLFRAGLLAPLTQETTADLPIEGPTRGRYIVASDLWTLPPDVFHKRLSVTPVLTQKNVSTPIREGRSGLPDTTSIATRQMGQKKAYIAQSPRGQALAGFVGGQTVTVGPATYIFDTSGRSFASLMLVPMDTRPIPQSRHLLLTVVGRVENQAMGWNVDRTSIGTDWGHGPIQAEAVHTTVRLKVDGKRTVYGLDPTGGYKAEIPSTYAKGVLTFKAGDSATLWYAIVGE